MSKFALDLSKFAHLTEKKMETVVKKVFIGLSTDIIKATPVDTGRARNNWFPSVNKFSSDKTDIKDKSGSIAISRTENTANSFKIGDTVTLTNNLPYIERLEYGWSKQAPKHAMVRLNVVKFKLWVRKEARKVK